MNATAGLINRPFFYMKWLCHLSVLGYLLHAIGAFGADSSWLDPHLEPLRPFLDKTWKGVFKNSKPDRPIADVMRWERALNGKGVRILHSVNDGAYGGESIIMWDQQKQQVAFHYFTTAGFRTVGTMKFKDGKVLTHEVVSGSSNTVSEIRATFERLPDGAIQVQTEQLKSGEWQPGRETKYQEAPDAKVIFR